MTRIIRSLQVAFAVAAVVSAGACAGNGSASPDKAAGGEGRPPIAVTGAPGVPAELTEAVDVVGSLAPKFSADIKSEVSGIVAEVYVTEWVPVRKGARLARLDTREIEAGIDALKAVEAQARVGQVRAQREYDRALLLKENGLITTQGLDDAKSALEAAQAAAEAARAQVRTGETRLAKAFINAPMDGVVALRGVNPGDRVENMGGSSPMFRIVDNRLLDLTVKVPTSYLSGLRIGQQLEFTTDAVPGRTFAGKVMFINPAVDEASRSASVVAEVPNTDGTLKGGLFVKGRIVVSMRSGVLQVPREALVNWNVAERTAEVFAVRNGQAEKVAVRTGTTTGVLVEVAAGLAAGDQVVTRGGFALRQGDRVTVTAATGEGA
jgi:membrane fusion protein, multidrug efflux system